MSTPPTATQPELTSQKRGMRLAAVVFPPLDGPTSAVEMMAENTA